MGRSDLREGRFAAVDLTDVDGPVGDSFTAGGGRFGVSGGLLPGEWGESRAFGGLLLVLNGNARWLDDWRAVVDGGLTGGLDGDKG